MNAPLLNANRPAQTPHGNHCDALFAAPVVPEAAKVFAAFKDVNDLKKLVERYDRGLTLWRNDTRIKIEKAVAVLKEQAAHDDAATSGSSVTIAHVNDILHTLETASALLTTPLEEEPEHRTTFKRLRLGSGAAGKFFRKHLDHAEEVRILNYDAVLTWRAQLLGLKSALMQET